MTLALFDRNLFIRIVLLIFWIMRRVPSVIELSIPFAGARSPGICYQGTTTLRNLACKRAFLTK